jgi:multiple sugar transport system substrate-binding protein
MTAAPHPSHRLTRRQLLTGLAGGSVTLLLAACGSSSPTATTAATSSSTTASATSSKAAPSASAGGATTTSSSTSAASSSAATSAATSATSSTTAASATKAASPASSPAASSFPSPTVLKTSGNVTVEFWFGEPPENGPQALADAFMKQYPGIKVNTTRYVNDDTGNTKLDTALQGGTPIDVYMSYGIPRLGQRIRAGVAEDLTSYIAGDPAVKAWTENTAGLFKYQGKFFSLPTVRDPYAVIVNKKLLDAAGGKLPAQWTIDDFHTLAKQVSSKDVFGCYAPPDLAREILGPDYWYKNGGKESNFDNPAFKQYLDLYTGMIKEKSAFPWTEVLAQNLRVYQQNVYLTSQAVLWPGSMYVLRYVNDKKQYPHDFVTTFAPLPAPTGVSKYYNPGSISNDVILNPKAKNKEAAWAFFRFRLTDGAKYMLKSGKVPAFPGTSPDEVIDGILGPDKDTLYDVAAFKKAYLEPDFNLVTDSITVASAEIQKIVQDQTDRCLIGEISVDQWVQTVKQQADDAIKKAG